MKDSYALRLTSDVFLELTLCLSSVSNDLVVSWCCGLVQSAPNNVIQKIESTQKNKQTKKRESTFVFATSRNTQ